VLLVTFLRPARGFYAFVRCMYIPKYKGIPSRGDPPGAGRCRALQTRAPGLHVEGRVLSGQS